MDIAALLTSAGINIAVCVVLFSLYSILRKQPSNVNVYFGKRLASRSSKSRDLCLDRFVPSPTWVMKAWETTQEEMLTTGGLDAVVFSRMVVFSIRVFSVAAVICTILVLPVNYYGRDRKHKNIPFESLEVFTIENVKEGSEWLWAHCLALYIITLTACTLLYFEYKCITNLRLLHITSSQPNPSHFAILVRGIPWSPDQSYCETVKKFFSFYHPSTYLSHQIVYKSGSVQKLKDDAEYMCKMLSSGCGSMEQTCKPSFAQCYFCGGSTNSFKIISNETDSIHGRTGYSDVHLNARKKECAAAFVFFKSRYAALTVAQSLQTSNPMLWVTDLAPEPQDVYWSNLCIPYKQLWIRKITTFAASVTFVLVFLIPVTFAQGLTQLDKLEKMFPFLTGMLQKKFVIQLVTGYLPSVILVLFLYAVPPVVMLFSTMEGCVSRSERKTSACSKFLYFTIWNVFFVNVFAGSVISQLAVFSSLTELPAQLAKAVPAQATYFTTYVLSSGWASLAFEIMQLFPLFCNLFQRFILGYNEDTINGFLTFPYHTEVPRILLFGFLGFTCSILAPLILPFLLFYFVLAYLVYRNQILNVYIKKYDSGGQLWPIAHNTTVLSLLVAQVIALGVFGIKQSPVASGFTFPLLICTVLFHQYCRQRFLPIFKNNATQVLIDMDRRDERCGRMEQIYEQLTSAYCQFSSSNQSECFSSQGEREDVRTPQDMEKANEMTEDISWPPVIHSFDKPVKGGK
ncbi:CSC1-like protein RXW8 isoform X1 [Vigna radiata var. radiata]|uniref:CSC1-like protein RXW8 isoform X1 n=1 Tax=Vigna radiata var. radiata TaxID=3916 RepID=A0A1S3U6J2_VIGRR|nr:CSC1-like protein RXW8 isoform X1 [Vigna radiata var. radiata]